MNTTYYLAPGTLPIGSLPSGVFQIPFAQNLILFTGTIYFSGTLGTGVSITLNVYKQDPNKDNFIFFNKTSRNFKVLKGEEFNQELDSNSSNLKIISGIDFNDGSYKASPRLYLK